jgi:hypothetical protein
LEAQQDFKDLLALLNAHRVDYLIVGAHALAYHGVPRFTGDMDIFINRSSENAQKILSALSEFGFGALGLTAEDFQTAEKIIQLGVPPVRIDLITSITAVSWEEANQGKQKGMYGDVSVCFLGRDHYLANKRAIGRKKDLADIETLGEE